MASPEELVTEFREHVDTTIESLATVSPHIHGDPVTVRSEGVRFSHLQPAHSDGTVVGIGEERWEAIPWRRSEIAGVAGKLTVMSVGSLDNSLLAVHRFRNPWRYGPTEDGRYIEEPHRVMSTEHLQLVLDWVREPQKPGSWERAGLELDEWDRGDIEDLILKNRGALKAAMERDYAFDIPVEEKRPGLFSRLFAKA